MNTTTTAPDAGYYVPTPADCTEAGMMLLQDSEENPAAYWQVGEKIDEDHYDVSGDFIVFDDDGAALVSATDQTGDRDLVFGDRDKCMAFLRNHITTSEGLN